jgi:pimeloyl-ACP methyl ester carboxylesterase
MVSVRGIETHLTWWGEAGVPAMVFLHGWADTGDTFQFVVDNMSFAGCVVAPDWRGFGRSQWLQSPYWFPDYLADLDALLQRLSPDRPVTLVGHSMGGNIAGIYAGVRPERVAKLVLLEGIGLPPTVPEQAPGRYRRWLEGLMDPPRFSNFSSIAEFAEVLKRRNPRLAAEQAMFIATAWSRQQADGRFTVNADPLHKLVNPVLYRREEVEAFWREIAAPVLCVLGAASDFRIAAGEAGTEAYYAEKFKHFQCVMVADAGHMMHHDQPEEVARLIEAFLDD